MDWTVVITMISMWMMEMTINKIVDVITVGNLFVTAVWTVNMIGFVSRTLVFWGA
jgi:hypothetical protein